MTPRRIGHAEHLVHITTKPIASRGYFICNRNCVTVLEEVLYFEAPNS
jgi:hypothetical protein